jgi:glycosyltransferase involved in cell wall biosynthesis
MRVTVLSHDLSTNAGRRTHRLAGAIGTFAEVKLIGPASRSHRWLDLPDEPWIHTVRKRRWPDFHASFEELVEAADGDVLVAVKPHVASFAVALVASELRGVPVILDIDDLDVALSPRSRWGADPAMTDLSRPKSPVYVSLLTRATGAADAITVCCSTLRERFGGTVIPQPVDTNLFDPAATDRERARRELGFDGPTVLFAGIPRPHKGLDLLADAVARVPGARLVVACRPEDLAGPHWARTPLRRVDLVPYQAAPALYAAADVVAIPQLDTEAARHQMPLKAVDAMAMGRPVVASAVSDLPELLGGCGRLVPPGDAGALAAALADLLRDGAQARELGERARERCLECCSFERAGARLAAVIEGLTGAAVRPAAAEGGPPSSAGAGPPAAPVEVSR